METIGAFDAKTRLSELLVRAARAARGESIVITKQGKAMARLVPENSQLQDRAVAAAKLLRGFRGEMKDLSVERIRAARHDGHRF